MSKDIKLMQKVEKNGAYFEGDYMYIKSHCEKCDEDFVLYQHDNPVLDDPRQLEFPHVCADCLKSWHQ